MEPHLNNVRNTLANDDDYCKCFGNGVLVNNDERTTVTEVKHRPTSGRHPTKFVFQAKTFPTATTTANPAG